MTTWDQTFGSAKDWCVRCPFCNGSGFRRLKPEQYFAPFRDADNERCPCWILYTAMARLWEKQFPRGYITLNWDSIWPYNLDRTEWGALLEKWELEFPDSYDWEFSSEDEVAMRFWVDNSDIVATKGLSIILQGSKGVGKTALSTVLAKEFTKRRGIDAAGFLERFVSRFLVCDELFEYLSHKDGRSKETINESMKADLLVVDDLRLNYTGWSGSEYQERLHSILQYRAGCNLPTIISVNKIDTTQDFTSNCITEFLGIEPELPLPQKYGKYRFIQLINKPLRAHPEWEV
jgi:hypothetical protein